MASKEQQAYELLEKLHNLRKLIMADEISQDDGLNVSRMYWREVERLFETEKPSAATLG